MTTNFFDPSLLLLFLDPGSEIRDPEWLKIRIRDKHPGSATLYLSFRYLEHPDLGLEECLLLCEAVLPEGELHLPALQLLRSTLRLTLGCRRPAPSNLSLKGLSHEMDLAFDDMYG